MIINIKMIKVIKIIKIIDIIEIIEMIGIGWRKPHCFMRVLCQIFCQIFCNILLLCAAFAVEANFDAGTKLYAKKDYAGAIAVFKKVTNPTLKVTALYYEALCHQQMGERTQGDLLLHQLAAKYPGSAEASYANQYFITVASNATLASINRETSGGSPRSPSASNMAAASPNSRAGRNFLPASCTVPFSRGSGGHIFVKIRVNGRPLEVMFDTGAEACCIGRSQLETAGVSYAHTGQKTQLAGVGVNVLDAEVVPMEIALGEIVRTCPILAVTNYPAAPLLGQSFFGDYRYQIDGSAGVIRFSKAGSVVAGGYDSINVPFTEVGKELLVHAKVDGHDCPMFFDTGSFSNVFSLQTWLSMGLTVPRDATPVMTSGVGGNTMGYRFRCNRLELGAVSQSGAEVVVAQAGPPCPLLGQDFLKDRQFTIDNENHVIKFVH